MKKTRYWVLFGLVLSLPACGGGGGDANRTDNATDHASLEARYDAAKLINDLVQRDKAPAVVAADAARAGDGEVAKKALHSINDPGDRDKPASSAAVSLARAGKVKEAKEVAQIINDPSLRDETLAKIAKGD